jgi:hypothetical protein
MFDNVAGQTLLAGSGAKKVGGSNLSLCFQEFHWDMYFRQFWNDDRLNFENKGLPQVYN